MGMVLKFIQYKTKENMLMQKDLSERSKKYLQAPDCSMKNVYTYKLDEIVDKYNNTYHKAI